MHPQVQNPGPRNFPSGKLARLGLVVAASPVGLFAAQHVDVIAGAITMHAR